MIQRRQTLHLFMVAFLGISLFFLPIYSISSGAGESQSSLAISLQEVTLATTTPQIQTQYFPQQPPFFVTLLAIAGAVGSIMFFKNRPLQMTFARGLVIISAGLFLLLAGIIWKYTETLEIPLEVSGLEYGFFLPLGMALFSAFAFRGIKADIDLVKSSDRIR